MNQLRTLAAQASSNGHNPRRLAVRPRDAKQHSGGASWQTLDADRATFGTESGSTAPGLFASPSSAGANCTAD